MSSQLKTNIENLLTKDEFEEIQKTEFWTKLDGELNEELFMELLIFLKGRRDKM